MTGQGTQGSDCRTSRSPAEDHARFPGTGPGRPSGCAPGRGEDVGENELRGS